jgi:hypothetical protein
MPREIMFLPIACNSAALVETAMVGEGLILLNELAINDIKILKN